MSCHLRRLTILVIVSVLVSTAIIVTSTAASSPPFGLPMQGDPGPSTWYVSQWYGNSVWASRNAEDLYHRGQGIHFGVDFAAPCGTDVVAIGDGVVHAADGPYGSPPHNLVIRHENGYYSLYGHLEVPSDLRQGDLVSRGDRVGQIGDPAGDDCVRAPHLHLETRTDNMTRTVNPVQLIDADWRQLTIGAATEGSRFAVDFENPSRWQRIDEQPAIEFGGPRINDYLDRWDVR